jgi:hypothetical protein
METDLSPLSEETMNRIMESLRFLRAIGHLIIIEPLCNLFSGSTRRRDSEW